MSSSSSSSSSEPRALASLVTVVVTSSPSRRHPSTGLLESLFESLKFIDGLYDCPRIIILDGYNIREIPEVKQGKISQKMADSYEEYCRRVVCQYESSSCQVIKSTSHLGFAFAVKTGLQQVKTPYAMILQHDRTFCKQFDHVPRLLGIMEKFTFIRYIGFPCSSSRTHASQLISRYNLPCFASHEQRISITEKQFLQPLLFWFDSNHLCHVKRYLEIFTPYIAMWPELKAVLGAKRIKKLVLRRGDFIEDRFGQMQRIILTSIIPNEVSRPPHTRYADPPEDSSQSDGLSSPIQLTAHPNSQSRTSAPYVAFLLQSFYWFGSYMVWEPTDGTELKLSSDHVNTELTAVFVRHLDGRRRDPVTAERKRAAGLIIQNQRVVMLGALAIDSSDEDYMLEFEEEDEDENEDYVADDADADADDADADDENENECSS